MSFIRVNYAFASVSEDNEMFIFNESINISKNSIFLSCLGVEFFKFNTNLTLWGKWITVFR